MNGQMNLAELVMKVVGRVEPVGSTETDDIRYENLQHLCETMDLLLAEIDSVVSHSGSYEYSRKRAGEYALKFLQTITDERM